MKYDISFTNQEITPWSGFGFLRNMMTKMKVREYLGRCHFLPQPGSNRGYSPITIIESFMVSVWCGANRFLHTEITRHDKALSRIFDWSRTPANDTYKRFFKKFDLSRSNQLSEALFTWVFGNVKFDRFTLDCDSSILTRYGQQQQGATKGYNPKKPGRNFHHPLIAFVNDVKLVCNFWLRSGNTFSANNFKAFLEDTLHKLKGKTVGLVRLDSGFYCQEVMSFLEGKVLDYIIAVRFYRPIQKMISLSRHWLVLDEGVEICEMSYQGDGWHQPRRMIIVRQKVSERPQSSGKMLSLFAGTSYYYRYRYSAYVTNLNLPPAEVWRLYRQRADSENRIKELKEDFGFDSFNLREFYATEAALTVTMFAYNLMSIFRMFVMRSEVQHTLSTLRYRNFAMGAYFQKQKGKYVLKVALARQ